MNEPRIMHTSPTYKGLKPLFDGPYPTKPYNNLILSSDRTISALQQAFCSSHGIAKGSDLKIAFIVNGVEVDPSTVEVRTTL